MSTAEYHRAYSREHYKKNREKYLERDRARWIEKKEQIKAYRAALSEEAKQRLLESGRKSYLKHRETRLRKTYAWWLANKARVAELNRRWHAENVEKSKEAKAKRRAAELNAPGSHTAEDIKALYVRQRGKCTACCAALLKRYHLDHIIPLSSGGSNYPDNLQLLCPPCNLSKGTKHPIEFMQRRGYLL